MGENYFTIVEKALWEDRKGQTPAFLFDLSQVQEGGSCRSVALARTLSMYLIGDDGKPLLGKNFPKLPFYPYGFFDGVLQDFIKKFLDRWNHDKKFSLLFNRFSMPVCHRGVEELLRHSLQLPSKTPITTVHVRRAVLSACLTLLRQSVGSCFATAPCILIQEEMLSLFLQDMKTLLETGRLKRIVRGVEHSVPFSLDWGKGDLDKLVSLFGKKLLFSPGLIQAFEAVKKIDPSISLEKKLQALAPLISPFLEEPNLTIKELIGKVCVKKEETEDACIAFKAVADHALLKAWEFTIASFAEAKSEFSSWNLYHSLGLDPSKRGGIGELLYKQIEEKLHLVNQKTKELYLEASHAVDEMKVVERLANNSASQTDFRRKQAEWQAKYHHASLCMEMQEASSLFAKKLSQFFSFLIEQYQANFPLYFQEVYDPSLFEFSSHMFEDSPAGFRLVYKHGRSDASLWTSIRTEKEFVSCVSDFFILSEPSISSLCETKEEKEFFSSLLSEVVRYLRSPLFLEAALSFAKERKRLPWSYISGGTMDTLLLTYFSKEKLTKEARWVESPSDLLLFLIDTLKSLPPSITDLFEKGPSKGVLMHSPRHAFVLRPSFPLFKKAWQDRGFTYTWIRDQFLQMPKTISPHFLLSVEELLFLQKKLSLSFSSPKPLSFLLWYERAKEEIPLAIDSFVYESFPLIPQERCQAVLQQVLSPWISPIPDKIEFPPFLTAAELRMLAKILLKNASLAEGKEHEVVAERCRELNFLPTPLFVADSNWVGFYLAFVVHPALEVCQLWRLDPTGSRGQPMHEWERDLTGVNKEPWVIFSNPLEYFLHG